MPRIYLLEAHINPDTDFKFSFAGSQHATVEAVAGGKVDAGVLSGSAWEKLVEQGKVDTKVVHVFYTTPGYFDYNWAVRADMNVNLKLKIIDAFLALDKHNAQDKEILDLQRASKFITTHAENYSVIEAAVPGAGSNP